MNTPNIANQPKTHVIIPARYASTRFPGKPLVDIGGKPMFWHVWHRAGLCSAVTSVSLATDDQRIATAAKKLHVPVIMTRSDHPSGTDRVFEAATLSCVQPNDIVINVQGDEPALNPECLTQLVQLFADEKVQAATLAREIQADQGTSPDIVKVVCASNGDALYFSRSPIPYDRDEPKQCSLLAHVGIYAFRMKTLARFVQLPPSILEQREKLEQLRLLENNIPLRVALTTHHSPGVDRPEDIDAVLPHILSY